MKTKDELPLTFETMVLLGIAEARLRYPKEFAESKGGLEDPIINDLIYDTLSELFPFEMARELANSSRPHVPPREP